MHTKKTILVVAPYYPPHTGGLERYAHEVAKRVDAGDGWHVVVLTTGEGAEMHVGQYEGLTVYRMPVTHKLSNTPFSFRWIRLVRQVLHEVQPDVVHLHAVLPGLQDVLVQILDTHIPLVVTYHGGSLKKGTLVMDCVAWVYEHTLMRILLWRANFVACSSDYVRKDFLARYMHKSVTLPPAVDGVVYAPKQRETAGSPTLMCVGGLGTGEEHKGLSKILTMLETLHHDGVKARLLVAGTGDLETQYQARVRTAGLEDVVTFLGRCDSKEMARAYAQADIFVLPSTNDSFPTVILEAMATGLPVVSTTVGSIADMVVVEETGFLARPGDMSTFTEHVRTLCLDKTLRTQMGEKARARVVATFRWEVVAEKYLSIYANVCAPKSRIVQVVSYFPPHIGGMEVVAQEVAEELAHRGYPTTVYTSREGARHAPRVARDTHLTIRRLRGFEVAHTPLMWSLPLRLLAVSRHTVVHVHVAQAFVPELVALLSKVRGFSFVAQFHLDVEASGRFGFLFPWYKKYVLGPALRTADSVLVFSEEQSQLVQDKYGVHKSCIQIIPNGVGDAFFHYKNDHKVSATEPLKFIFVGRLAIQKRVDRLIRAVALCDFPLQLTVVGDGELRDELERLAQELCPGKVSFVGAKKPKQVRAYYRKADVFVLPSDKEGMPLTLLEAMATGLPVVGADVLGVRELVDGVGVLVRDPSPETFAQALQKIDTNRSVLAELQQKSRACARAHRWPCVVDRIEKLYGVR